MLKLSRGISFISCSEIFLQQRWASDVLANKSSSAASINEEDSLQVSRTFAEAIEFRNKLYDENKKKQLSRLVPRLEKIEVHYQGRGISDNAIMFMNKNLSTPHQCAMHISKIVADSAVLALLTPLNSNDLTPSSSLKGNEVANPQDQNGTAEPILWDMHRPIPCDCKLEILKFNMENSTLWHHQQVNRAYWNSCTFILGAVVQEAFKQNYQVGLYNFPYISENRGAFCYDIMLDDQLRDWNPAEKDFVYFTKLARSIISRNLKFERLEVTPQTAMTMFEDDQCRFERIQAILETKGPRTPISLYRAGQYIDISIGPHISNTSLIYHYVVVAFHRLAHSDGYDIRRMQGLSLPKDLRVHHAVWSMLENRARKLVKQNLKQGTTVLPTPSEAGRPTYGSIENQTKQYMKSTGQWMEGRWKNTKESFNHKSDN